MIDLNILRQIPLFSELRDEQFEFAKLGRERWIESGEILAVEGEPSGYFWVLLEGEVQFVKNVGDRRVPWANFGPQSYFGHELILLNQPYLTTARATLKSYLLEFDTQGFWKMMELCPSISRDLLILTAQRTQDLGTVSMQVEKLVSLGTLTSGLAQELRQVAAAGRQSVQQLQDLFQWLQTLTVKLNAQQMTFEQQEFLLDLQKTILERRTALPVDTNSLQHTQQEEIIQWLTQRSIPHQQHFAQVLTRAGLDTTVLDDIANVIPPESVCAVLAWLKTTLKSLALANDVELSTQHIAELVQAAKDYTYLDQAPLQEMDIYEGIERTLTILNHRLAETGIQVVREYDPTLPPICVYGSDLNQVWTHLIDNAIDAMAEQGQLTVRTAQIDERVLVEIIDNGPGIPPEIQPYIFDQFFTTKVTDNGTGLGLPIAYRVVVDQHHGQIQVSSEPGRTCFQVYLPMDLTESNYIPATQRSAGGGSGGLR